MNNTNFHGITSLILIAISTLIGLTAMTLSSWIWGGIFLVIMILTPQMLLRTYCAKCPCKAHCRHVFPGRAAMAFEKDGPYTLTDFLIIGISVLLLIGLPQFWLWQNLFLFGVYWVLSGIGIAQILLTMCPRCNNVYCPVKAMANRK